MAARIAHQRLQGMLCALAVLAAPSHASEDGPGGSYPADPPPGQSPGGPYPGGAYPAPWSGQGYDRGPFPPRVPRADPRFPHANSDGPPSAPRQYGPRHQPPAAFQSQWFRRPYPYHLDYYRMRYGGSYAPYFGNIYGPPVLFFAPPYPYYGSPYFR